ncbi:MAG TPA: malectin domain-containing carbohydrate-binding protein, partial [Planctomycetota bacterium]|nr:malectin domain-containing carbohydrate-binding protein [Planctomycetota bacterium]
ERARRWSEALEDFDRASELDPGAVEPLLRRIACHRALGELDYAEALARGATRRRVALDEERLLRAWHQIATIDQRRAPADVLALWPRSPSSPSRVGPADLHRRLVEDLVAHGTVRIDCGGAGGDLEAVDAGAQADGRAHVIERWMGDSFFLGGAPVHHARRSDRQARSGASDPGAPVNAETIHATERRFVGPERFRKGYSIPLPPGRYRVSLCALERTHHYAGRRVFDVVSEGNVVLEGCDPIRSGFAVPNVQSFEVAVEDGALEIDFVAHRDDPRIAAIEVRKIEP